MARATPLHRYYHSPVGLPSCVTPSLAYYQLGSPARPPRSQVSAGGVGGSASLGSAWAFLRGYGNINPLSIDYACRPRLRSRLTLGGLAWPRNPWSSGGGGSHSPLATHACILTRVGSTAGLHRDFTAHTTLPYPPTPRHPHHRVGARVTCGCHSFGGVLEPRYIVGAGSLDQ